VGAFTRRLKYEVTSWACPEPKRDDTDCTLLTRVTKIRKAGKQEGKAMALEHEALTERIIGAAIEVHRRLGPGFLESIYEKALIIELKKRGLAVQDQVEITISYDELEIGRHRLDLIVEGTIVVELKAIKDLENIHFAIVRSYLKAVGRQHGLLLNFAKITLEAKRVMAS
jgi:GxxExxY protein